MIFIVKDQFHREIRLTKERFEHISERPELKESADQIKETVLVPEIIKQSKQDKNVWLYYKLYSKTPVTRKYLVVIVKILNSEGFIITSFYTNKVKRGETIWKR